MEITKNETNHVYGSESMKKTPNTEQLKEGNNPEQTIQGKTIEIMAREVVLEAAFNMPKEVMTKNILGDMLISYGLAPTEENLKLIDFLVQQQQPVTKENVLKVKQGIQLLGNNATEEILFMLKQDISITVKNAEMTKALVTGENIITQQLDHLYEAVGKITEPEVKALLLEQLEKVCITPSRPNLLLQEVEHNGYPLDEVLKKINIAQLNFEEVTFLAEQTKDPILKTQLQQVVEDGKQAFSQWEIEDPSFEWKDDLKPLIQSSLFFEKMPLKVREEMTKWLMSMPSNPKSGNMVDVGTLSEKASTHALRFKVEGSTAADLDLFLDQMKEVGTTVKELAQKTLPQEARQAIENACTRWADTIQYMKDFKGAILQLPFFFGNQTMETEIRILKEEKKNKNVQQKDGGSAYIAMDTMNLGKFKTFVQKNKKTVALTFQLEDEEIVQVVKQNIHLLNERLKERNYQLGAYRFKVETKEKESTKKTPLPESNGAMDYKSILFDTKA